MIRYHLRRSVLFTGFLLLLLTGGCGLWLRSQHRQYALNRQLIAALVKGDDKQALALVNEGADPNTCYKLMPVPSLLQLTRQLLHRSPLPINASPSAFMIACGAPWKYDDEIVAAQRKAPDAAQLVQAMLTHHANINAKDEQSRTLLMWAVMINRSKTARLLLEHGANVNAQAKHGYTPLTYAIGSQEVVRLLLDHGAEVNTQDEFGWTALYGAVLHAPSAPNSATIDVVRQLLAHGANPNLPMKDGFTALKLAQQEDLPDLVALLKHYRARK
jgi:ankyrin repeat protein